MRNIPIVDNRTDQQKPDQQLQKKEIKAYPTPEEEFEKQDQVDQMKSKQDYICGATTPSNSKT